MNHACRWCHEFDCAEQFDHDRLFRTDEKTWRMTVAQRTTCPECRGDVRTDFCPARPVTADLRRAA